MAKIKPPPFIAWRDGRPRFVPGPRERELGFRGQDLKHDDGRWYSLGEAWDWHTAKQADIVAQRSSGKKLLPTPKASRTVTDLLLDWLNAPKTQRLAPATVNGYRKQVNAIIWKPGAPAGITLGDPQARAWREPFGMVDVAAIEPPEVNAFIEYQIATRGLYMARASRAVIKQAFGFGRTSTKWRLKTDPVAGLRFETPKGRIVLYTDAEIRALVAAADAMDRASIGDSIFLGLFTGQRQTDRRTIEDAGLVDGRRHFRQSKTGAIVAIPETPQLARRVELARKRVAEIKLKFGTRADAIVLDETTGMPYNEHTYRHVFDDVRALAIRGSNQHGLAPCPSLAGKRDQDLRDTAVTWLARAGATIPEIASITGHSLQSIYQVLQHYLAITPELADAAIGKLLAWMKKEKVAL